MATESTEGHGKINPKDFIKDLVKGGFCVVTCVVHAY